ncbi:MAG TPA: hypothetical protein VNI77_04105 [Nitrososphaera sp.]|nr:hypothetical protein [Nitrososphaera sp.]
MVATLLEGTPSAFKMAGRKNFSIKVVIDVTNPALLSNWLSCQGGLTELHLAWPLSSPPVHGQQLVALLQRIPGQASGEVILDFDVIDGWHDDGPEKMN